MKLEQALIDFMQDDKCPFLEVGGHFNAVILKGNKEGTLDVNSYQNAGNANSSSGIVGLSNLQGVGTIVDGGKGNWTSFQKLILHRLADRFQIVREAGQAHVVMGNNGGVAMSANNNGNGLSPPQPQQMIRLVKNKSSRIPGVKLIDLNMSDYNMNGGREAGGRNGLSAEANEYNSMKGLTTQLAMANIKELGLNPGSRKGKKKEKVQIMKRSSAGKGSSGSLAEKQGSKRRTKKLSEKEKLYAEARARIFNDESTTLTTTSTTVEISQPPQDSSFSDNVGDTPDNIISNDTSSQPSQIATSRSSNQSTESGDTGSLTSPSTLLIPSQLLNSDTAALDTMGTNSPSESPSPSSPSTFESVNTKTQTPVPAAATGGGSSKVLWRNRQQEASDPDFQRSHHPVLVSQVPLNVVTGNVFHSNAHPHYSLSGPTAAQQQHMGTYFSTGMENNSSPTAFAQRSSPAGYLSSNTGGYTKEQPQLRTRVEPLSSASSTQSSQGNSRFPSQIAYGSNVTKSQSTSHPTQVQSNPHSQALLKEPHFVSIVPIDKDSPAAGSANGRKMNDVNTPWGRSNVEKTGGNTVIYKATEEFPELR